METTPPPSAPDMEAGPPPPPSVIFKAADLTYSLPEELHNEIREKLDRAKELEESANQKLQESLAREKQLEETRERLEREKAEIRASMQQQLDIMQRLFDEEKETYKSEMTRVRQDFSRIEQECKTLRETQKKSMETYRRDHERLDTQFLSQEQLVKDKLKMLSQTMASLAAQEDELAKKKQGDAERAQRRDKNIQKLTGEISNRLKEAEVSLAGLTKYRKKLKALADKKVQTSLDEMQIEYNTKNLYYKQRLEDLRNEEERLEQIKNDYRVKEQLFNLEVQRKAEERVKKRVAELNEREQAMFAEQEAFAKEEESLLEQRRKMMKIIKTAKGAQLSVNQVLTIVADEEKALEQKRKFLKYFKTIRTRLEKEYQDKTQALEAEQQKSFVKVEEQRIAIFKEKDKLRAIEDRLIAREREELQRLEDSYDDLKTQHEISHMEHEERLDEQHTRLEAQEKQLLARETQIIAQEQAAVKKLHEREQLLLQEIEETQKTRQTLLRQQEELSLFIAKFQSAYQQRLEFQNQEYKAFKQKIEAMEAEAQQLNTAIAEQKRHAQEEIEQKAAAMNKRFESKESMLQDLEKTLGNRVNDYLAFARQLQTERQSLFAQDKDRQGAYLDLMSQYEQRLHTLGNSMADLSNTFTAGKESGSISVIQEAEPQYKTKITKDGDIAKLEWPIAVRYQQNPEAFDIDPAMLTEYLDNAVNKWDSWIKVPPGQFVMRNLLSRGKDAEVLVKIEKPLLISKFPLTNVHFAQFVHNTRYKTDAEKAAHAIIYNNGRKAHKDGAGKIINYTYSNPYLGPHRDGCWLRPNGEPESLFDKYDHPVTQVSWQDALAYCRWRSEVLGQKVRLPTSGEWEYVARNFGQYTEPTHPWSIEEMKGKFNIQETGIDDTTPVDYFPEQEATGGAQDLYGNIFEWVLDARPQQSGSKSVMEYKLARGGSFLTHYEQIAPWRHMAFAINYCSAFLGFRIVIETD